MLRNWHSLPSFIDLSRTGGSTQDTSDKEGMDQGDGSETRYRSQPRANNPTNPLSAKDLTYSQVKVEELDAITRPVQLKAAVPRPYNGDPVWEPIGMPYLQYPGSSDHNRSDLVRVESTRGSTQETGKEGPSRDKQKSAADPIPTVSPPPPSLSRLHSPPASRHNSR